MTQPTDSFDVLIRLPGRTDSVVAGRLFPDGAGLSFRYDPDYMAHPQAIPIFDGDLPLRAGDQPSPAPHRIAPSLRDALPDRWGRRAITASLTWTEGLVLSGDGIEAIALMQRFGADRIGALDFQRSGEGAEDVPAPYAPLEDLMRLADLVDAGAPLPPDMLPLIRHCASVGGARPKALFTDAAGRKSIAKFTAFTDCHPVVLGEFVAMRLAERAGIDVAPVRLAKARGLEVLLVERFDRQPRPGGGEMRHHMVSALTWTQVGELSAHHITWPQLAEIMDRTFDDPEQDKAEMFARIVFNILVGNTDDHARNHAAFWDGEKLHLTPAYDIAPQRRMGREANQAMVLADGSRAAQLRNAAAVAPAFGVTGSRFRHLLDRLVGAITCHWAETCDEAGLTRAERAAFAGCQFLNDYAFEGHGRAPRLR